MSGYNNQGFEPDTKDSNFNNLDEESKEANMTNAEEVLRRDEMSDEEVKREKRRIMKNVIVISFSFMLLFTAFQSISNLQSSINKVDGLGIYSQSVIYATLVFSCAFLPSWVIKKFTVKWAMVLSMLCYSTYIAAQFYPEFYTLIPAAIILGLGAAPMWSAKCTYISQIGNKYAELSGVAVEPIIVRFFGIFFLFFQFSSVWGNLISSKVLSTKPSAALSAEALALCGANYCPTTTAHSAHNSSGSSLNSSLTAVDDNFAASKSSLYTLAGIYLACSLLSGIVIAFLVDPLTRYGEKDRGEGKEKLSGVQLLAATFNHLKKPYQILIIPLTFWSGVEQGFFNADFTAGYISCAYGVQNIGYVLIVFGVCDAVCSFSFGYVIKHVGRVPIFLFGMIVNIVVIAVLFSWAPNPDQAYLFYVLAGLWGVADAVWQTQINALYGVLFDKDEEAAFSNYRLWESLGFIFAYILQDNVCVYVKLWIVVAVLLLGMSGYLLLEGLEWRKNRIRSHSS